MGSAWASKAGGSANGKYGADTWGRKLGGLYVERYGGQWVNGGLRPQNTFHKSSDYCGAFASSNSRCSVPLESLESLLPLMRLAGYLQRPNSFPLVINLHVAPFIVQRRSGLRGNFMPTIPKRGRFSTKCKTKCVQEPSQPFPTHPNLSQPAPQWDVAFSMKAHSFKTAPSPLMSSLHR